MAIKQSTFFAGMRRTPFPKASAAGVTITVLHTHSFTEAVTTSDKLELMPFPAGARLVAMSYDHVGLPDSTLDMGIMSGTPGDPDNARTVGDQIFDGTASDPSAETIATLASLIAIAPSESNRSIGVIFGANVAADPTKKLHVRATFAF